MIILKNVCSKAIRLEMPKALGFYCWIGLLGVISALSVYVIVFGFLRGHENVYGTNQGVPWGILVSTYIFFVVTSTGICLVSSLGHVFGVKKFLPLGKRAVFLAMITLIAGFISMAAELERPWRLFYAIVTPNVSSAIWWMSTLYAVYFMFMATEFLFLSHSDTAKTDDTSPNLLSKLYKLIGISGFSSEKSMRFARMAGIGGVVAAITAHSTLGAIFGLLGARAFWHGPYAPIYFILSAFVSGSAVLALVLLVTYKVTHNEFSPRFRELVHSLGKLLLLFIGILAFFMAWKLITAQYGQVPGEFEAVMILVRGPLSLQFWTLEVLMGILVPSFILLNPRTRTIKGIFIASLLVLFSIFTARYDFVLAGQMIPVMGREALFTYKPSPIEITIVIGAFAICMLLYSIGEKYLSLKEH